MYVLVVALTVVSGFLFLSLVCTITWLAMAKCQCSSLHKEAGGDDSIQFMSVSNGLTPCSSQSALVQNQNPPYEEPVTSANGVTMRQNGPIYDQACADVSSQHSNHRTLKQTSRYYRSTSRTQSQMSDMASNASTSVC